LAKNLAKSGGILSRKRKVVVFRKFCTKSGGFMLLTHLTRLRRGVYETRLGMLSPFFLA
jgi:hypothetical protein